MEFSPSMAKLRVGRSIIFGVFPEFLGHSCQQHMGNGGGVWGLGHGIMNGVFIHKAWVDGIGRRGVFCNHSFKHNIPQTGAHGETRKTGEGWVK